MFIMGKYKLDMIVTDYDSQPSKGPIPALDPAQKRYLYCRSSLFFPPSSILL